LVPWLGRQQAIIGLREVTSMDYGISKFTFKLRGLPWTVKILPKKEFLQALKTGDIAEDERSADSMGITDYDQLTIYVRSDMHIEQIKSTTWHEIFHAVLGVCVGSRTDTKSDAFDIETVCNLAGDAMIELLPQFNKFPILLHPNWMKKPKAKKQKPL
jgi:hypothetical protein